MRIVGLLVLLAAVAHAETREETIAHARALEQKLAYDEALAIVDDAIRLGHATRAELVELHLLAGRLNAGLDRPKPAEDHFAIVLALAPSTTLPDGTSPKIAVPFTVARTKTKPLEVKIVITDSELVLESNNPIVTGMHVTLREAGANDSFRVQARRTALPSGTILSVGALDATDNELWRGAPPEEPVIPERPIRVDRPPVIARWTTWAAITGVALAAGGFAAWRFDSAQNEFDRKRDAGMTDFSDLQAIEGRGRRWGLTANITFGVAAATGIATVILFVRRPRATVTVTPNTVGVAATF